MLNGDYENWKIELQKLYEEQRKYLGQKRKADPLAAGNIDIKLELIQDNINELKEKILNYEKHDSQAEKTTEIQEIGKIANSNKKIAEPIQDKTKTMNINWTKITIPVVLGILGAIYLMNATKVTVNPKDGITVTNEGKNVGNEKPLVKDVEITGQVEFIRENISEPIPNIRIKIKDESIPPQLLLDGNMFFFPHAPKDSGENIIIGIEFVDYNFTKYTTPLTLIEKRGTKTYQLGTYPIVLPKGLPKLEKSKIEEKVIVKVIPSTSVKIYNNSGSGQQNNSDKN